MKNKMMLTLAVLLLGGVGYEAKGWIAICGFGSGDISSDATDKYGNSIKCYYHYAQNAPKNCVFQFRPEEISKLSTSTAGATIPLTGLRKTAANATYYSQNSITLTASGSGGVVYAQLKSPLTKSFLDNFNSSKTKGIFYGTGTSITTKAPLTGDFTETLESVAHMIKDTNSKVPNTCKTIE